MCEHFRRDMTCTAFPSRIPIEIASGQFDHLAARPGQVGSTMFEVVRSPSPAQRLVIEDAAQRGTAWAPRALERLEAAGGSPR